MPSWQEFVAFTERPFFNNTVFEWLLAGGVTVLVFVALRLIQALLVRRAASLAERFQSEIGRSISDVLASTRWWFLLMMAAYLASSVLRLSPGTLRVVHAVAVVVLLLQAGIWSAALMQMAIAHYARGKMETDAASVTTMAALGFLGRVAIWAIVVLSKNEVKSQFH